jgi:transcriptional regulator with XRE-family HTH domain
MNLSQESLSFDLGVSFQQIQKYEAGENRISASKIYELSKILKISPYFFFEGLEGVESDEFMIKDIKAMRAMEKIYKIKNRKMKEGILNMILNFEE